MHAVGGLQTVTTQLARSYGYLPEAVATLDLPIAVKKTGFLASSTELARRLCEEWELTMDQRSHVHRDLGGDATAGRLRRVGTQHARFVESQARAARLQLLRHAWAAVGAVHRAGPSAVGLWGSAIHGVPNGKLKGLRLAALRAEGRLARGASSASRSPAGGRVGAATRSFS